MNAQVNFKIEHLSHNESKTDKERMVFRFLVPGSALCCLQDSVLTSTEMRPSRIIGLLVTRMVVPNLGS